MIKFIDLYSQYRTIKDDIDQAISNVICDSAFIGGKYVEIFEKQFALYQEANYCVGVGNGTDALEIAIESLDLPNDSEIIVPGNSFIASSEAVTRTGHSVIFCDINTNSYTLDINDLERKITAKTAAIIAVHLYGHPCDMKSILDIARSYKLKVIEDCAQAHGAEYKGKRVGAIGDIGTFSFYPGKNLGAYGDGGAIISNDLKLINKCRMIANHGRLSKFGHKLEGRNSRLDGIQAGILNVKLGHLDKWIEKRRGIADIYKQSLINIKGLTIPEVSTWAKHVYHLYVIRTENRNNLRKYLSDNGIETGIHYPVSLPKLDAYTYHVQHTENFNFNQHNEQLLCGPATLHLPYGDAMYISSHINDFFR